MQTGKRQEDEVTGPLSGKHIRQSDMKQVEVGGIYCIL